MSGTGTSPEGARLTDLFPRTVYRNTIGFPGPAGRPADQYRDAMIDAVYAMESERPQTDPSRPWTSDTHGFAFVHKQDLFRPLFARLADEVGAYLDALGLRAEELHLYWTRSWAVIVRAGQQIREHAHRQSHISLAYYLTRPEGSGPLVFVDKDAPNQIAPGLFHEDMGGLRREPYTARNAREYVCDGAAGDVVIFPSASVHGVRPGTAQEDRLSLSADIVVTLKDTAGREFLMPDIATWDRM